MVELLHTGGVDDLHDHGAAPVLDGLPVNLLDGWFVPVLVRFDLVLTFNVAVLTGSTNHIFILLKLVKVLNKPKCPGENKEDF